MKNLARATTAQETPVFIGAGADTLFALVARPLTGQSDVAVVMLSGGPKAAASVGRNRFYVRLCRALSEAGLWSVRFDYHGTGESTGELEEEVSLGSPFVGDLRAVCQWLETQGIVRYVFVGTCFGSRAALAGAPHAPGLVGMGLIAPPVRDMRRGEAKAARLDTQLTYRKWLRRALRPAVARGLLDRRRREGYVRTAKVKVRSVLRRSRAGSGNGAGPPWLSPSFVSGIESVVDRGLPILFVYGEQEVFHDEFRQARSGPLGELLDRAGDQVTMVTLPHPVHGFTSVDVQNGCIDAILSWASSRFGVAREDR